MVLKDGDVGKSVGVMFVKHDVMRQVQLTGSPCDSPMLLIATGRVGWWVCAI